jgi:hypothetical protein
MWNNIGRDFPVTWKPRREQLTTTALAGNGVTKYLVLERLRRRTPAELEGLKIVLAEDYFVLFGEKSRLPWGSGGVYLGCDPKAPNLLMPVSLETSLPTHLFEHVLRSRIGDPTGQIAVLPQPLHLIAIADAKPILESGALGRMPARRRIVPAMGVPA